MAGTHRPNFTLRQEGVASTNVSQAQLQTLLTNEVGQLHHDIESSSPLQAGVYHDASYRAGFAAAVQLLREANDQSFGSLNSPSRGQIEAFRHNCAATHPFTPNTPGPPASTQQHGFLQVPRLSYHGQAPMHTSPVSRPMALNGVGLDDHRDQNDVFQSHSSSSLESGGHSDVSYASTSSSLQSHNDVPLNNFTSLEDCFELQEPYFNEIDEFDDAQLDSGLDTSVLSGEPLTFDDNTWDSVDDGQALLIAGNDFALIPPFNLTMSNEIQIEIADNLRAKGFQRQSASRTHILLPDMGSPAGRVSKDASQNVFRISGRSRNRFDDAARQRTEMTRRVGACDLCKAKKQRCDQNHDPLMPCARCASLGTLRNPCIRQNLLDIKLFRLGTAEHPMLLESWAKSKEHHKVQRRLQNGTWAADPPRKVCVTQDLNRTYFPVTLSRFHPTNGDETAYKWTDTAGDPCVYHMPHYYISDMQEARQNILRWFQVAKVEFLQAFLARSNILVQKTFIEAERYRKATASKLIEAALDLWSASRLIERTWLICGEDLLDFKPMERNIGPCRRNRSLNAIPVTPVMDTQLDELSNKHILLPLKTKLLTLLRSKMLAKKKEDWYEIFLATFITLDNEEAVLHHADDFAKRFGLEVIGRANSETSLSYAYHHACKTLLAYYHFAAGGIYPLSTENLDYGKDMQIFEEGQVTFLSDLRNEIGNKSADLKLLTNGPMYKVPMYWTHQMLFKGWKADTPYNGIMKEFTEKDFLFTQKDST